MRGKLLLVPVLAAGLLASAAPAIGEQTAGPTAGLPEEVEGGVIVELADGDRFKATISRDERTVWGSRYDAATSAWSQRTVVLREKDLQCGSIEARGAGTAVALMASCDVGGYSEDTVPTDSRALYSPDTVTWSSYSLPGEAEDEPGISPDGANAIWPLDRGWLTSTATGFTLVERNLPDREYTITGTISDTGDVSVLYGAQDDAGECAINVLTASASGAVGHHHRPARHLLAVGRDRDCARQGARTGGP